MADITHGAWIKDDKAVDAVYQSGVKVYGRNLLINTAKLNDSTVCLDNRPNTSDTYLGLNIFQTNNQWSGLRIYFSYLASKIKTNTNYVMSEYVRNTSPTTSVDISIYGNWSTGVVFNSSIDCFVATLPPNSGWTRISAIVNIASFSTTVSGKLRFESNTKLTDGYVQFAGYKLEKGSVATPWTPALEDVSDYGRNLLVGTSSSEKSYTTDFSTIPGWNWSSGQRPAVSAGSTYTYSIYFTKLTGSFVLGYWGYDSNKKYIGWFPSATYSSLGKVSWTFTIPSGISYISPHVVARGSLTCTVKEEKLEKGDVATPWTPAPEDVLK